MADRRKRSRISVVEDCNPGCAVRQIEVGESSTQNGSQNGHILNGFQSAHDAGASVSKCSVRLINEVVSGFNQQKMDLVRSIGFEGILHFPHIKQFNRKFTLWLMSCVNERTATINVSQDVCISFNKFDVGKVIGIPAEGKTVLEPVADSRGAKDKVIQQFLGPEFIQARSIKIAQEIVQRDYGTNINKEDADMFRVAFVVFVVSNLLAPSAKHDYASVDYWNAIENPDEIASYDWAEFVFVKLIEGVIKLKNDIANNIKFPNITGCSLFLQVIYLDSLNLEGPNLLQSAISKGLGLLCFPISNNAAESAHVLNGLCSNDAPKVHLDDPQSSDRQADTVEGALTCYYLQPFFYPAETFSDEAANSLTVNQLVASIMAQFYSIFRRMKRSKSFDLNDSACPLNMSSSVSCSSGDENFVVSSPWELGYVWGQIDVKLDFLISKITALGHDERLAIVHRQPKYIQVSVGALSAQFTGKAEMELDLFDALIRSARQHDDILFSSFGSLRWRHFFESDYMAGILSGEFDLLDPSIRNELCLSEYSFDLSKSRLVFFPALLQSHWVCFVWQPLKNVICVFDPGYCSNVPSRRSQLLERACYMLKLSLKTLSNSVFLGLNSDPMCSSVCIMNLADPCVPRMNWSGVLCSMFYRCFDGSDLVPRLRKVDVEEVAVKLFYQLRDLKENSGHLDGLFGSLPGVVNTT